LEDSKGVLQRFKNVNLIFKRGSWKIQKGVFGDSKMLIKFSKRGLGRFKRGSSEVQKCRFNFHRGSWWILKGVFRDSKMSI
jgi:hypothetical protein